MEKFFAAVFTLTGTVIGAGVFGLPFVIEKVGFWSGFWSIVVLGLLMVLVNLMVGELSLRTKGDHQLIGFAERYIGREGRLVMLAAFAISCYTAILAYTIGVAQTLSVMFNGPFIVWLFFFYAIMAFVIFGRLNVLTSGEYFMEFTKFIVFIALIFFMVSSPVFDSSRLEGFSFSGVLVPFGVVLFAFGGLTLVPILKTILKKKLERLRYAIILGMLIPGAIYILFSAGAIGLSGPAITEVATLSIAAMLSPALGWLVHLFAVLAMVTSFLAFGFILKWMYMKDFGLSHGKAWSLTVFIPPLLVLAGMTSFYHVLDLGGSISTGLIGVLIIIMHARAKKLGDRKPEYSVRSNVLLYSVIAVLFAAAIINSLVTLF